MAMGRRGPPPKPSALKKLEGTFRTSRATRNEVEAPPGSPPKPDDMPKEASARWDELVPVLLERKTLAVEDGAILEAHCRAYAQWKQYQVAAEAKPMVKTPWGPKVNPAAAEAVKWETRVTITGDRLGLSASSRSRVGAKDKEPEKDPTEDFLFGRDTAQVIEGGRK
jgi:P27 family predicted phage terminase small subunit